MFGNESDSLKTSAAVCGRRKRAMKDGEARAMSDDVEGGVGDDDEEAIEDGGGGGERSRD